MKYVNYDKVKILRVTFLNLLINPFLLYFFFIYIKMSKSLSVKYYEENKERLQ